MRRSGIWSHKSGGIVVAIAACAFCAGIGMAFADAARSSSSTSSTSTHAATVAVESASARRAALGAAITFSPAPGATAIPPNATVTVKAGIGTLSAVRVTTPSGASVAGAFAAGRKEWLSTGHLAVGTTYRVDATAADAGLSASASSSFTTLTPIGLMSATIFPNSSLAVGVAQPIVIRFNHYVTSAVARVSVEHRFTITESIPVAGGWHWFNNLELHFRPEALWPTGEKISVAADFDGWDAGNGLWGAGQTSANFSIGDARISTANLATDQMTVTDNGKLVATYPFSGGKVTDPTMNGIHIVLDRSSVVRMISSSNGIPVNSPDGYDELVYSDVHISDSGEYVHAAPWSVTSQGHANVSHGCINLSPADALRFLGFSRVGDVVVVTGGPRPPAPGDHGVMDWDTPWTQWTPGVVHSSAPPAPPKPVAHKAPTTPHAG